MFLFCGTHRSRPRQRGSTGNSGRVAPPEDSGTTSSEVSQWQSIGAADQPRECRAVQRVAEQNTGTAYLYSVYTLTHATIGASI